MHARSIALAVLASGIVIVLTGCSSSDGSKGTAQSLSDVIIVNSVDPCKIFELSNPYSAYIGGRYMGNSIGLRTATKDDTLSTTNKIDSLDPTADSTRACWYGNGAVIVATYTETSKSHTVYDKVRKDWSARNRNLHPIADHDSGYFAGINGSWYTDHGKAVAAIFHTTEGLTVYIQFDSKHVPTRDNFSKLVAQAYAVVTADS